VCAGEFGGGITELGAIREECRRKQRGGIQCEQRGSVTASEQAGKDMYRMISQDLEGCNGSGSSGHISGYEHPARHPLYHRQPQAHTQCDVFTLSPDFQSSLTSSTQNKPNNLQIHSNTKFQFRSQISNINRVHSLQYSTMIPCYAITMSASIDRCQRSVPIFSGAPSCGAE